MYVLLTKFWNESNKIPSLVDNIVEQEERPALWMLLDDGSTDGSLEVFEDSIKDVDLEIQTVSVQMPQKTRGNLNTLGYVYKRAWDVWGNFISTRIRPDYLGMIDVDSIIPPEYFSLLSKTLSRYDRIGSIAGSIKGEQRNMPMGSGKLCRWNVFERAGRDGFWVLDADAFLNIKAVSMGYWLIIINDLYVDASPSRFITVRGQKQLGSRMFYVGRPFPLVFYRGLRMILDRRSGWQYIHGWGHQVCANRGWRCKDSDVNKFYSINHTGLQITKKVKRSQL